MKSFIVLIVVLSLSSCGYSKLGLSQKQFESKIEKTAKLNIAQNSLANGWYSIMNTENNFKRIDKKKDKYYFINPKPIILPDNFYKGEEFKNSQNAKGLAIYFDEAGIKSWSKATLDNKDTYLIFILDNEILAAQLVNAQITNGASAFWKDDLSERQWNKIKAMIKR